MPDWTPAEAFAFEGHTIRYGVAGPADAPAMVLLHGTPFSSHVWHRLIPWLARRHRVYAHDLLGYGASDKPDADVSLGVQNRAFAALLEHWGLRHWGLERPHVVAHDFGGATALRAHLLDGADYASLTLIDPVAIRPWGSPFVSHVRAHEAAFAGMPAYAHAALLTAYLRTAVHRDLPDAELAPYLRPWTGPVGQAGFYRQIAQMDPRHTDDVAGRYGELRCPVQLLWGVEDGWIPLDSGRRLAGLLPAARFIEIPGAGHLVPEDAPEAILAALAAAAWYTQLLAAALVVGALAALAVLAREAWPTVREAASELAARQGLRLTVTAAGLPVLGVVLVSGTVYSVFRMWTVAVPAGILAGLLAQRTRRTVRALKYRVSGVDRDVRARKVDVEAAVLDVQGEQHYYARVNGTIELLAPTEAELLTAIQAVGVGLFQDGDAPDVIERAYHEHAERAGIVDYEQSTQKAVEASRKALFHALREESPIEEAELARRLNTKYPEAVWRRRLRLALDRATVVSQRCDGETYLSLHRDPFRQQSAP